MNSCRVCFIKLSDKNQYLSFKRSNQSICKECHLHYIKSCSYLIKSTQKSYVSEYEIVLESRNKYNRDDE